MRTTIDKSGRILVPKAIRQAARLTPGVPLEIRLRGDVIEIEPAYRDVEIVRRGRFYVAVPKEASPPLPPETVEETRRRIYEEPRQSDGQTRPGEG